MIKISYTSKFKKSYKKIKRSGKDIKPLKVIMDILETRKFTEDEIKKHKVHKLNDSKKYKNCMELHVTSATDDWLLIYKIQGDYIKYEETLLNYVDTGSHTDLFDSKFIAGTLLS